MRSSGAGIRGWDAIQALAGPGAGGTGRGLGQNEWQASTGQAGTAQSRSREIKVKSDEVWIRAQRRFPERGEAGGMAV